MRIRRSASVPVGVSDPDSNTKLSRHMAAEVGPLANLADVSWASIDESSYEVERGAVGLPRHQATALEPSPSSASSTASVREPKEHCRSISDEGADVLPRAPTSSGNHPAKLGPRCLGAQSSRELVGVLRAWRRKLRHEHAALETDRQRWRSDARRAQKAGNRREFEILADVRAVLDERAASLNGSIDEYRALECRLAAKRRSRSRAVSTSKPDAGAVAAAATEAAAHSLSVAAQAQPQPTFSEAELRLQQRWQHVLAATSMGGNGATGAGAAAGAAAAAGGAVGRPRRAASCGGTAAISASSSSSSAFATAAAPRRPMAPATGTERGSRVAAHAFRTHAHAERPRGAAGGSSGSPRGGGRRATAAPTLRSASVGGA